jgi:signal peptidase II
MSLKVRYAFLALVVVFGVIADQWSKHWAETRLSVPYLSAETGGSKSFVVEVPAEAKGQSVQEFLKQDLTGTPEAQVARIAQGGHRIGGRVNFEAGRSLEGGEALEITAKREVVVVEDFFTFRYARNPGAAFSFLAKADPSWRKTFFLIMPLVALGVVMVIYHRLGQEQRAMMVALSLVMSGALGNWIDRARFGWVIDFISWHYKSEYYFPTFNIADSFITVGIILMALGILLTKEQAAPAPEVSAAP